MPSINWTNKRITLQQSELTLVSGVLYELDVDAFRLALKDIEDSEEGVAFDVTHRHNTQVVLSGVTYARTFEIINGYSLAFEDTGSAYTVRCVGANHNLADVFVPGGSEVSLIIGNSAGLIAVSGGGGGPTAAQIADAVWDEPTAGHVAAGSMGLLAAQKLTAGQETMLTELFKLMGLDPATPLVVSAAARSAGAIAQTIATASGTTTVTRAP